MQTVKLQTASRNYACLHFLFQLYFFPFRFIVKTVDSRDNVTAFKFFVRDVTFRVAGDSDDMSRVVQVDFLAGEETVDDKILRICLLYTSLHGGWQFLRGRASDWFLLGFETGGVFAGRLRVVGRKRWFARTHSG